MNSSQHLKKSFLFLVNYMKPKSMKTKKKDKLNSLKKQLANSVIEYYKLFQLDDSHLNFNLFILQAKIAFILVKIEGLQNTQKPD